MAFLEILEQREHKADLAILALVANLATKELLEILDRMDFQVQWETLDQPVQLVLLAGLEHQVVLERLVMLDYRVCLDLGDLQELWDQLGWKADQETWELQDQPGRGDLQETLDFLVHLASLVEQVVLEKLEHKAIQDYKALLETLEV